MVKNHSLKKRIRARMAVTGEGYQKTQRPRYQGVILHEWNKGLFDEVWVCEHKHYSVDDAKDCAKQSAANRGGLDPRESVIAVSVGEPRQGIPTGPKVKGNRG